MRERKFYIVFLFSLFVLIGCGGTDSQDNGQERNEEELSQNSENQVDEATEGVEISKANTQTIQAKFDKLVAGTDGAVYVFRDKNGKTYEFFRVKETKGLEFTKDIDPLNPTDAYDNVWFKVTFESRELEFFDGGTGENVKRTELVILQAERLNAQNTGEAGIMAAEVKNAIFFGTEPNWTIKFYDSYAEYEPMGEAKKKLTYLSAGSKSDNAGIEEALQHIASNEVTISVNSPNGEATITVKRENCNDGMSENTYPYSIVFKTKGSSPKKGCGRIKNQ